MIFQTYFANLSLRIGIPTNQYQIYHWYFYTKLFYLSTNLLENTLKTPISCNLNIVSKDQCLSDGLIGNSILTVSWFLIEAYFTYIVYVFYKKNLDSDIALRRGIDLEDWPMLLQEALTDAIPIEVKGFRVETQQKSIENMLEDILITIPILSKDLGSKKANENSDIVLVILNELIFDLFYIQKVPSPNILNLDIDTIDLINIIGRNEQNIVIKSKKLKNIKEIEIKSSLNYIKSEVLNESCELDEAIKIGSINGINGKFKASVK